jgi:hypothetical protein
MTIYPVNKTYPSNCFQTDLDVGEVHWSSGSNMMFFTDGWKNIEVHYTAGYDEIPYDLQMAVADLVAWRAQSLAAYGIKSESLQEYSYSKSDIESGMPSRIKNMLSKYHSMGNYY